MFEFITSCLLISRLFSAVRMAFVTPIDLQSMAMIGHFNGDILHMHNISNLASLQWRHLARGRGVCAGRCPLACRCLACQADRGYTAKLSAGNRGRLGYHRWAASLFASYKRATKARVEVGSSALL
jgi:hypothetical protein